MPWQRISHRNSDLRKGFRAYSTRFMLRRWGHQLLDIVFPDDRPSCLLCHRPMPAEANVVSTSYQGTDVYKEAHGPEIPGVCLFCLQDAMGCSNHSVLRMVRVGGDVMPVACGGTYESLIRHAMRQWKYDGVIEMTDWFARICWEALEEYLWNGAKYNEGMRLHGENNAQAIDGFEGCGAVRAGGFDAIVPVPTTRDRYHKRGYHHVLLLAQALQQEMEWARGTRGVGRLVAQLGATSEASQVSEQGEDSKVSQVREQGDTPEGVPVEQWLVRVPDEHTKAFTQSQTAKTSGERFEGLRGVFHVPSPDVVRDKHILLVDDVVTTGATLGTCAKALMDAGARKVTGVVVAMVR